MGRTVSRHHYSTGPKVSLENSWHISPLDCHQNIRLPVPSFQHQVANLKSQKSVTAAGLIVRLCCRRSTQRRQLAVLHLLPCLQLHPPHLLHHSPAAAVRGSQDAQRLLRRSQRFGWRLPQMLQLGDACPQQAHRRPHLQQAV